MPVHLLMTDYSDSDVKFVQDMIPHHQAAVDMAAKAYHAAKSSEVKEWARTIWAGQTAEIEKFKAWLNARGLPLASGRMSMR